jgi:diaphanous 1
MVPPPPSASAPLLTVDEDEAVRAVNLISRHSLISIQTSLTPKQEKQEFLSAPDLSVQGSLSSINLSVGRGDLDQAIRSLRTGRRRPRQERPLSKIFLDGGQNNRRSRLFE